MHAVGIRPLRASLRKCRGRKVRPPAQVPGLADGVAAGRCRSHFHHRSTRRHTVPAHHGPLTEAETSSWPYLTQKRIRVMRLERHQAVEKRKTPLTVPARDAQGSLRRSRRPARQGTALLGERGRRRSRTSCAQRPKINRQVLYQDGNFTLPVCKLDPVKCLALLTPPAVVPLVLAFGANEPTFNSPALSSCPNSEKPVILERSVGTRLAAPQLPAALATPALVRGQETLTRQKSYY